MKEKKNSLETIRKKKAINENWRAVCEKVFEDVMSENIRTDETIEYLKLKFNISKI